MKHIFMMALAAMFMFTLASCASSGDVSYVEARNYFHNNNAPVPANIKITTQSEFDSQFGMATTMGEDGKPTPIDFEKQFVLAKVLPVTDVATEISPVSLKKQDGQLQLTYAVKMGEKMSYSMQPIMILIVDNKYKNLEVKEIQQKQ